MRTAFGAQRLSLLGLFVGQGLRLAIIGAAIGLPLAALSTRLCRHGVRREPAQMASRSARSPCCSWPSRVSRAICCPRTASHARVDPVEALRQE